MVRSASSVTITIQRPVVPDSRILSKLVATPDRQDPCGRTLQGRRLRLQL